MKNGVITRKRGVIPGCRVPEAESHMAVEGLGHSWLEENFPPPSTPGSPNSQRNPAVASQARARPTDGVNRRSGTARRDAAKSV
jgi:hypothetical protein